MIKPTPVLTQPTEVDIKLPSPLPIYAPAVQQDKTHKWGWGARREQRRKRQEEQAAAATQESQEKEEVQKIKEAVDKIWAERKQAAVEIQATANEKVSPSLAPSPKSPS